jgi:flagellar biogenesis protein FliO
VTAKPASESERKMTKITNMTADAIAGLVRRLSRGLRWLKLGGWRSHSSRQLRLLETLALGERRFVAVIEFEQEKFLIGGSGNSVAMLATLPSPKTGGSHAELKD